MDGEWVTQRGASAILATGGIGYTMSRRILAAGLAGEPVTTPAALLYDARQVGDLLMRPEARPAGPLLEIRVAPDVARAGTGWDRLSDVTGIARLQLRTCADRLGSLPTVVTCCGFVIAGAETTGIQPLPDRGARLEHRAPGAWFPEQLERRRLSTGPGNAWRLLAA